MQVDAGRWDVVGHDWAIEHLTLALNSGRLRHAYLISGPPAIGKTTLARNLAQALNCTEDEGRPCHQCRACTLIARDRHPDVQIVEAERVDGTLKIDQIRALRLGLSMRAYEGRYRVAIIRRFHEAQGAASNALLKTLEEPPANVVIILTTDDADVLLPTIRSRCQHVPLHPLPIEQIRDALEERWNLPWQDAQLLAHLSGGRLGWVLRALEDEAILSQRDGQVALLEDLLVQDRKQRFDMAQILAKDKSQLLELLQVWQLYWRDAFLLAIGSAAWMTHIDREPSLTALASLCTPEQIREALMATRRAINYLRRNVNTRLAVEAMVLDYPILPTVD